MVNYQEVVISSSPEELASSSSSPSSSVEASREGDGEATKPPITAYHRAIRLMQVFTSHNSSEKVLRRASICLSCAKTASRFTSLAEQEGVEVEGIIAVTGLVGSTRGHFNRS